MFLVSIAFGFIIVLYNFLNFIRRRWYIGNLSERYILITGCDTGFGNLAAKRLDSLGCHVIAACFTEKGETEVKKSSSSTLTTLHLDVTSRDSVQNALKIVEKLLPPGKGLYGLVNNAGVSGLIGPIEIASLEDYRSVAEVNLYGLIDVTMTFLPLVKKAHGRIVNTSSIAARIIFGHVTPYTLAKYGVESFTDSLRVASSCRKRGVKAIIVEPIGFNTTFCDLMEKSFRNAWERTSAETRNEFGEDFLKYYLTVVLAHLKASHTGDPMRVAEVYEEALLSKFPKARYVVGVPGFLLTMINCLPESLCDWFIIKMFEPP